MHLAGADLLADAGDLLGDDVAAVPVGGDAGGAVQEVLEHVLAVLGVLDLGVPLHAVEAALVVGERGDRGRRGRGEHVEALRRLRDGVAVAHPHGLLGRLAGEQRVAAIRDASPGSRRTRAGRCGRPRRRGRWPSPGSRSRCRASGTPRSKIAGSKLRGALGRRRSTVRRRARCRPGSSPRPRRR